MIPRVLFKYLHPDRVDVVEGLRIRFSQPGDLNDPRELNPLLSDSYVEKYFSENIEPYLTSTNWAPFLIAAFSETYKALPAEVKANVSEHEHVARRIAAIKSNPDAFSGFAKQYLSELKNDRASLAKRIRDQYLQSANKKIGVLSLSADAAVRLMWGHYAHGERGFALGFDTTTDFFRPPSWFEQSLTSPFEPVNYIESQPTLEELGNSSDNDRLMLYTKTNEWAYEQEWRLLRRIGEDSVELENKWGDHPIHLYPIPPQTLTSVILGSRISEATEDRLRKAVSSSPSLAHVEIYRISDSGSSYDIVKA